MGDGPNNRKNSKKKPQKTKKEKKAGQTRKERKEEYWRDPRKVTQARRQSKTSFRNASLLLACPPVVGNMAGIEITFHNQVTMKVQAQIFAGRTLVSTSVASPGETILLPVASIPYDIYFKNGATGWEMTRQLNSKATTVTLLRKAGRYITVGG